MLWSEEHIFTELTTASYIDRLVLRLGLENYIFLQAQNFGKFNDPVMET